MIFFDIIRQKSKNLTGTIIYVFSILIDTNFFIASPSLKKITKVIEAIAKALIQKSLALRKG